LTIFDDDIVCEEEEKKEKSREETDSQPENAAGEVDGYWLNAKRHVK